MGDRDHGRPQAQKVGKRGAASPLYITEADAYGVRPSPGSISHMIAVLFVAGCTVEPTTGGDEEKPGLAEPRRNQVGDKCLKPGEYWRGRAAGKRIQS